MGPNLSVHNRGFHDVSWGGFSAFSAPDHGPDNGGDDVVGAADDRGGELALGVGNGRLPREAKHLHRILSRV